MSGRVPRLLLAAVAVSMVATACGSSAGGGSVKEGGLYRLGSASSIDSLNPFVAFQEDAYSTFEQIYPMLVQYNPKLAGERGRPHLDVPHAAERQVVRREAADRGRRGLDVQHDPEVRQRADG